jgi:hypothetical protein
MESKILTKKESTLSLKNQKINLTKINEEPKAKK